MSLLTSLSQLGKFWQDKGNGVFLRWTTFFILIQIALILYRFNEMPTLVPFYYSLPWGEARLASFTNLFLLPTFSICITIVNHMLAIVFQKSIPLLSRLLTVFSLVFSFLAFFAILKITSLVV